ncbi:Zn-dependent hydrolase [Luminiphilus sp.]|nr:Zn-dependent hydrolase [Luminiphilus sp.]MDB2377097.1 Zn-dependent hydrolase [Luminiphilus sp.]
MSTLPEINSERLWARLMAMAKVGATAAGGCNRQALTDEDRVGRDLFMQWCQAAGCDVRLDEIGNIFARREGSNPELPPVITGSHLDTQPTGGKFDGIYGVLAGLEVIESLNDGEIVTEAPIEVVVWTNEEGCRFDTAMMGSAVWSGQMTLADAYALTDEAGASVGEELRRIGHLGATPAQCYPVTAAFEAHIEQGPMLEATERTIGIVTGVQHMSRHRIDIDGQEAHAGPTPMSMRKDPMMALARFLPQLYQLAEEHAPDGRMTFGVIHADPGSNNTVPGHLMLTADIRHPQRQSYDAMLAGFHQCVEQACSELELPCSIDCFWDAPGVAFDEGCINAVRVGVERFAYSSREMFSGAGHDAVNVSSVAPTAMIFIPCEGGLSHNEAENAAQEDVAAGCNVLLHAMIEMASVCEK